MRLDLLLHGAPDASFQATPELGSLVDPDGAEPGCDREPFPPNEPVGENQDARREERAKLDVVAFVFAVAHRPAEHDRCRAATIRAWQREREIDRPYGLPRRALTGPDPVNLYRAWPC
jgi:hypothetical protein